MDYLRYWSLSEAPFGPAAARFFFAASPQRDVTSWVQQQVVTRQRLSLIVCPGGVGATTLLQRLSMTAGFDDCAIEAIYTTGRFSSVERVYNGMAESWGMTSRHDSAMRIQLAIDAAQRQSLRTVWLVDGVGKHSAEAIAQLTRKRLSLTIIAAVAPRLLRQVQKTLGKRNPQTELSALSLQDTIQFLNHSLQVAGCRRQLFTDRASALLHEISDGKFRRIAKLADRALTVGASKQAQQITPTEIRSAKQADAA